MNARVLIVDDEASIRFVLERALAGAGLTVAVASSLSEARAQVSAEDPDVVLLDVGLPDGSGLELVGELAGRRRPPHVVVMTARESMEVAVEAMKAGAQDFVVKPFSLDGVCGRVSELAGRPRVALAPEVAPPSGEPPSTMVGASPAMVEVFKTIGRVAPSDITALILGESGTGKELVARAIHDASPRAEGPFITVNCAAIPRELMESELFGHERGAFTGAVDRRKGKFELASGGTLFLDEVGELPLAVQAKLLRALQARVVERVGGALPVAVDARIVAATHRDLDRMVADGGFREDLFYRLNVVPIAIPPLRERPGDVRRLVEVMVARWGPELSGRRVSIGEGALRRLEAYSWPGNVRELENTLKRALLFVQGGQLRESDLEGVLFPREVSSGGAPAAAAPSAAGPEVGESLESLVRRRLEPVFDELVEVPGGLHSVVISEVERALVTLALERAVGNQIEAARLLGINRNTLRKKLKDLGVELPERRRNRRRRPS